VEVKQDPVEVKKDPVQVKKDPLEVKKDSEDTKKDVSGGSVSFKSEVAAPRMTSPWLSWGFVVCGWFVLATAG
jgi:hypothetical protein